MRKRNKGGGRRGGGRTPGRPRPGWPGRPTTRGREPPTPGLAWVCRRRRAAAAGAPQRAGGRGRRAAAGSAARPRPACGAHWGPGGAGVETRLRGVVRGHAWRGRAPAGQSCVARGRAKNDSAKTGGSPKKKTIGKNHSFFPPVSGRTGRPPHNRCSSWLTRSPLSFPPPTVVWARVCGCCPSHPRFCGASAPSSPPPSPPPHGHGRRPT